MPKELCKILTEGGVGEIEEKKSRFIAALQPVSTEEEALAFIQQKKKEHWDARHNCYAYVIGRRQEYTRCSDDGEPAQTAGRPMLDVLLREGVTDVVAVVTRYFGGVLLGTGGLVRAYQGAVREGLSHCACVLPAEGRRVHIAVDYNGYGKVEHLLREADIPPEHVEYGAGVSLSAMVPEVQMHGLVEAIADATGGAAEVTWEEPVIFVRVGEEVRVVGKLQ